MQEAVPSGRGAMAAVIGLASELVVAECEKIDGSVAAANFNAPDQTVLAGETSAVALAVKQLRELGARRVMALAVSAPFHCELMRPAMEKLEPLLQSVAFRDPTVPVVSNVTAEPYRRAEDARELLCQQVCAPVRWVESVRKLADCGVTAVLEVGPGKLLSALVKRIEPKLVRANVSSVSDVDGALAALREVL